MASQHGFPSDLKDRFARTVRWTRPVVTHRYFWLGVVALIGAFAGLYLIMNHIVMPMYTRQGAAVTVPEVRELSYEEARNVLEERDLQPERRDQPFNPSLPRDAVVDQNPQPRASVKPGRRIYLYVNSGARRIVTMPDVRNETRLNAESTLRSVGLSSVEVRQDKQASPNRGTVTKQSPEPGATLGAESRVTLWVSPGLGNETVTVPDVRGLAPVDARRALLDAGLWVDPTRSVGGSITRQDPEAEAEVREGTEVRIYAGQTSLGPEGNANMPEEGTGDGAF
jgi:beta-lactam-binding protein with PASTA domain